MKGGGRGGGGGGGGAGHIGVMKVFFRRGVAISD